MARQFFSIILVGFLLGKNRDVAELRLYKQILRVVAIAIGYGLP
jgi:hypothetical protein